jgi:thermitase
LNTSGLKPRKRALIAIVDSGVDINHEDLKAQFISSVSINDVDSSGHGTHCAGIAGAVTNNGIGVASLIPNSTYVSITSVKVINAQGIGNQLKTIQGIIDAADLGADVISLSLGSISSDRHQKAYEEAVKYANQKGAIVIAAAGNNDESAKDHSPANVTGVIAVSAIGSNHKKAPFSNTVDDLDYGIAAPGVKILSTYPNQVYKELNGTSMATPMVAGLVGLLKAFQPELTTQAVYQILHETGKPLTDGKATGKMIQAADALEKVID